jgi:PAS domain S-box-containing protein
MGSARSLKTIADKASGMVGLEEGLPEEIFWSILEKGDDGILVLDSDARIIFSNSVFLDLTGFNRSDISRHNFYDFIEPDQRESLGLVSEIFESRQGKFCREITFLRKDGSKVVTDTCFSPDYERTPSLMYVYVRDLTEWKRIEGELKKANSFFVNLIESSVDGIIAADVKGNIIIFNRSAEQLTGYKAEEVIGGKLHITEIYPEGVAKEIMRKLRSEEYGGAGKLTPVRIKVLTKEGEEIPIELSAALVYEEGHEIASVGIFTDLRERLKIEEQLQQTHLQLVQSEKMASVGKLAAGVAHEINNPLGGILIYASLMLEDMPEDDPKREDIKRIVQETTRCKEIVKSLLEFGHQSGPKFEPVDVNRAIVDGLFFLENQAIFHNIEIVKDLDPFLPRVMGNASQLKQVFMNMVVNAADAMSGNGKLTIRTRLSEDETYVTVEFTDTGVGIPEENLSKIFDPFFTTKEVGKGTGLGLAVCYGIAEKHGGRIEVESKVGEGTTFRIILPVKGEQKSETIREDTNF